MKITKLQVAFIFYQVEEVAESEVAKSHQVADWLHNIPRIEVEWANTDKTKLSEYNWTAQCAKYGSLKSRRSLNLIN